MSSAIEISESLIARTSEMGDAMTQLKLQKLVYYVQGWALAIEGEPRFSDAIEAWEYGPVVYALRQQYGAHGRNALPIPDCSLPLTDDPLIDSVLKVYGVHEAEKLIALTHLEQPWKNTYKPFHERIVIEQPLMRSYFTYMAQEFEIHCQFLDVWRAKKNNVIGWKPAQTLSHEEGKMLERAIAE